MPFLKGGEGMEILPRIQRPHDVKNLTYAECSELAGELRKEIIDTVSLQGGHLASNLGVVELTIALHRVFDSPKDRIIFDVGHQIYAHKLLTGRAKQFHTLRSYGGISGFPNPDESEHDLFVTGHSSTSISMALGMARARDLKKEDYHVVAETPGIVEISNIRIEGERLKFDIGSLKKGRASLEIGRQEEGRQVLESVYVHMFGIITVNTFFGKCTASVMIPLSILIILVLLYIDRFKKFRIEVRENAYSYRNTMNFGLIVFMTFLILYMVMILLDFGGIDYSIKSVLASAEFFASFAFPVAFIVSLLVSLSNLNLMRKEGANWRNMLGFILGVGICFMTILPELTYGFIMRTQVVDIFNEKAIATHVYSFLEHSLFFIVVYLECILLGAIVFGIRSAKNIPSFDKDYILILGSQIRPDGTLTPLLQSRADRAIEVSDMQKKESGKDI